MVLWCLHVVHCALVHADAVRMYNAPNCGASGCIGGIIIIIIIIIILAVA